MEETGPRVTAELSGLDAAEVVELLGRMRSEIDERYPEDAGVPHPNRPTADQFVPPHGAFVLARIEGRPVGCGGIRPLEPGIAEIKRMFTATEARRSGVGRAVLAALEDEARKLGYRSIRLETGTRQPEAIALYEAAGFRPIPCFDIYEEWELSRCFEKRIG